MRCCCPACCLGLGVRTGDRVATLAWNSQAHVEAWYAIMGMGAVCHTLNPRLTADQTASMLRPVAARRSSSSAPTCCRWRARSRAWRRCRHILIIDGDAKRTDRRHRRPAAGSLARRCERRTSRGAASTRTSPAASASPRAPPAQPKGVTYTHRSSYLHTLRLLQADVMGITANDTVLPVVPMFHANAWGMPFAAPAVGARAGAARTPVRTAPASPG